MPRITSIILISVFSFFSSIAQTNNNVSGVIKDTTNNKFVQHAVVALISPADSSLISFARTNDDGKYQVEKVPDGDYIFMVMHPDFADFVEDINVAGSNKLMQAISLTSKAKLLEAVILKTGNPIRIKGDTTIYTADSFKVSANANVEELLKKMPGIQVDQNGQIKAMGETVDKVLVDGEEFFGDDPGMAVKNLRADAVKEVQVFKKQSDQAEFTGIDDGQSKQTINLKLKENKKVGYFGKIDLAGGPLESKDPRYNSNLLYSSFKGKRKLSAFLLNGNTGQDGLSWQDREKYSGTSDMNIEMTDDGGIMMWSGGGSSDEEAYVNTQNGFITNVNAGLQYSNKFKDKNNLNISPKYNSQLYNNNQINFTQTQIGDSVLNDNSTTRSNVDRYNFKINGSYDIKLDSNNSIKVTGNVNTYHTESEEQRNSVTTGENGNLKNTNDRILQINSDKQAYKTSVLFRHKFKTNRRTLSVNADWNFLNTTAGNFLKQNYQDFINGTQTGQSNQFTDIDKSTTQMSSKAVYTEPLSKKYSLELAHEIALDNGKNNQSTYSYTASTGKYDNIVDTLSNNFDQHIITNRPSFKINYADKKIKYNVGLGVGFTKFDLDDNTYNKNYLRNYTNYFPTALFTYSYKSNHSLRLNYNGRTRQPSLNQLQPLRNNNDQFNQYVGNPNLKQSFTNSFNVSHNAYNFLKEKWNYFSINANVTNNAITNNRIINTSTGYTTIQPINTNGNYTIGMWSGFGMKLKKLNLNVEVNPQLNFNRSIDLINSKTNSNKNLNAGLGVGLNKSKVKKYEIRLGNDYNYNRNENSLVQSSNGAPNRVTYYSTNTLSLNSTVYYNKVWSVSTEYNFYYRQKTSDFGADLSNHLWNARLQRSFKKDEFTVYLQARDILNQNIGVERSFNGIIYREETNDRLKRYFMVGFRWDFKNKAPQAATN